MSRELPSFVHLDADAFFVAVERALDPSLRGKKVAVGGRQRGIISSASYEARACGVYTPMPTSQALRVCPDLILVNGGMGRYGEFSRRLFGLCETVTPLVERRSIDEGFMDVGPCGWRSEEEITEQIRILQQRIRAELDLPVSFGLATTKLVAAIASKQRKPEGFTVVAAGAEGAFLAPLPIGVLPGVGKKTEVLLKANGVVRVEDLLARGDAELAALLGRDWREWQRMAQGEDDSEISLEHEEAKSYSQQETFAEDVADFMVILRVAKGMLDALLPKVRADGKRARTLTVKVRYPGMGEDVAGRSLAVATDLEGPFYALLEPLLRQAWRRRAALRLVAVRLSGIEGEEDQLELFRENREREERLRRLAETVDALNALHTGKVRHGHQLDEEKSERWRNFQ